MVRGVQQRGVTHGGEVLRARFLDDSVGMASSMYSSTSSFLRLCCRADEPPEQSQ